MSFADLEYTNVAPPPAPSRRKSVPPKRPPEGWVPDPERDEATKLIMAKLQRYGQVRRKDIDCTLLVFRRAIGLLQRTKLVRFIGNADTGHWVLLPTPAEQL